VPALYTNYQNVLVLGHVPRPEKVLCVHGDERSVQDLSSALYHDYNMRTFALKNLETFRFE